MASDFLFESGCHKKEGKLRLLKNFNNFSEIPAALNLRGAFVRSTEFELRCEVYCVVSFKLIRTFVAFTVRGKTTN